MKLRIASDIHTEFFNEDEISDVASAVLPPLPDDSDTVLILAGDIGAMSKPACLVNFMDCVAPRFLQVLYIPGNHEYYHGNLRSTPDHICELTAGHDNLYFTEYGGVNISAGDDPKAHYFHMHTLWTDFDDADPRTMLEAQMRMNDYRFIHADGFVARPQDTLALHRISVARLEHVLLPSEVVITHHMPSHRSVPAAYKDQGRINGAYASNLEPFILEKKPKLWIHGHTHDACDYMIGDTRILCNPRGYGNQYKKNGYNPTLVVEI